MDLIDLESRVLAEIDGNHHGYVDGLVGEAWSEKQVRTELQELRSALVAPYSADVVRRDTAEQIRMAHPPVARCAITADDKKGMLLAFDPAVAEYLLVQRREGGTFESLGVNGDAVGCFMAR